MHYRFSLDREVGRRLTSRSEAEREADRIRTAIREAKFRNGGETPALALTFRAFADVWRERRGYQLVRPRDNDYRLGRICEFVLPGTAPPLQFGDKQLLAITTDDIEAFRDARRAAGLSPVTVNHDLKLLRKMFNWGIRKDYLPRTPFKIGTEPAIALEREIPRDRRFQDEEDESRLLDAASFHLRAVIIALLDTCCRPGEILSLQWQDVNFARRELRIRAANEKTRTAKIIPISSRLLAVLEMRKLDAGGQPFGPDAYVFGDTIGRRVKSVRAAWNTACRKAGLRDFQLRDLRHEAGSRFDEAGVSTNYVSKMLGHQNLSTTTRYLNITRRGLHLAMQKFERSRENREPVASSLQDHGRSPSIEATSSDRTRSNKPSIFLVVNWWCGRGDSNPHKVAPASPSSWCVCQFRHFRVSMPGWRVTEAFPMTLRPVRSPLVRHPRSEQAPPRR